MFAGRIRLTAAAVLLTGCSAIAAPTGSTNTPSLSPTASPTPEVPVGVAQVIDFGEAVWGVEAAGDTVWFEGENVLYQLDGATGEALTNMPGFAPSIYDDTLWYLRDEELVAADPSSGEEQAVYQPPKLGTLVHEGVLWAADEEAGTLSRINLKTNKVLGKVNLPRGEPKWVEYWEGAIWVVIDGSDVVLRVDPATGKIIDTVDAGSRPHSVAIGFGSLWVTLHGESKLLRLAPDGTVQATIPGPGINVGIAIAGDYVWASSPDGVMQLDPATNEVVKEITLGFGDWYALGASGEFLWLTTADAGKAYQIPTS